MASQNPDPTFQLPLALSIRAPWSQFILWGIKDVENRVWRAQYTGVLFLHISKKFDEDWKEGLDSRALDQAKRKTKRLMIGRKGFINWKLGTIAGMFICHGADRFINSPWCSQKPGMWYMRFTDVYAFEKPIPCPGKLKLFRPQIKLADFAEKDLQAYHAIRERAKAFGFTEPL